MKYLILLIVGGILWNGPLNGQVVITPQVPSPGAFTKPQLWNLAMINTSGQTLTVRIQLTITERNTNQPVLTGVSRFFVLENGARQITHLDASPIVYQNASPSYQVDNSPNGFLPVGVFNICYTVNYQVQDALETLADECQTIEVEPMSPPQLIIPADSEKVSSNRPMFTWTPPMPYQFFSGLSYEFSLVEVMPYQAAAEAIQLNVPLYRKTGLYQTQLQYPEAVAGLDTGKLYAWRIFASNNTLPIASSEVWTFRVDAEHNTVATGRRNGAYIELNESGNTGLAIVEGVLQMAFDNRNNAKELKLKFKELSSTGARPVNMTIESLPLQFGKNYLKVDLQKSGQFKSGTNYLMEVEAGTKKMSIKFQFRQL
jgi:hypothetical protein